MAYKITYGRGRGRTWTYEYTETKEKHKRIRSIISVIFCIICCAALIFELYRTYHLPGRSENIQHAFSSLTDDLQQGKSIGDAVFAFCEEIATGAET